MGTVTEWMRVLGFALVFGILTIAWDAVTAPNFTKLKNLLGIALSSFLFGLVSVFEWAVILRPIALIFVPATLGLVWLGIATRRARLRSEIRN
jgi:apolipoprotein N-acyltransferase